MGVVINCGTPDGYVHDGRGKDTGVVQRCWLVMGGMSISDWR